MVPIAFVSPLLGNFHGVHSSNSATPAATASGRVASTSGSGALLVNMFESLMQELSAASTTNSSTSVAGATTSANAPVHGHGHSHGGLVGMLQQLARQGAPASIASIAGQLVNTVA
jgi:hypothetical protein